MNKKTAIIVVIIFIVSSLSLGMLGSFIVKQYFYTEENENTDRKEENKKQDDYNIPVPIVHNVTGVQLNKKNIGLKKGKSETLIATILPSNASNKKVIWTSNNKKVATVDSKGKVTAVGEGKATITVKTENGSKTAKCIVIVSKSTIHVTSITLNKSTLSINTGKTEQLMASTNPTNATNTKLIWYSSDEKIVKVDSYGRVTGIAPGVATITVKSEDDKKTSTCKVTVSDEIIYVTDVTLNTNDITLYTGKSTTLAANVNPGNATNKKVTWKSSNTSVATVDQNGKIMAFAPGTSTITVTTADGNKNATCNVTVKNETINVTGVTLNKSTLSLNSGSSETLIATVTPSNATNKKVTWKSSNAEIAKVDSTGKVTAVKDGTVTITATTSDGGKTATCKVTVTTAVTSIKLNKTDMYMLPEHPKEDASTYKSQLKATISPSTATDKTVTWTSSNTSIATVDSKGNVVSKKAGTVTITAKSSNGKTAKCTIYVRPTTLTNIYEITPTKVCTITRDLNNDVRPMQGVYFYKNGTTYYALYAGFQADDKPTVMTLVNLNSCTIITKNNNYGFEHANDIAYYNGKYYVIYSGKVHGITIKNNNQIVIDANPIQTNFKFSGFEYDTVNKKFYIKAGNYLQTFPSFTSAASKKKTIGIMPNYYTNIESGNIKMVSQGLTYANGNLYLPRTISDTTSTHFNHTYIMVYDATTGKYKYTMHFSGNFLGHLEGINVIGDTLYMGMNFHQTSPKNQTFLKYTGLSAMEKKYQDSLT